MSPQALERLRRTAREGTEGRRPSSSVNTVDLIMLLNEVERLKRDLNPDNRFVIEYAESLPDGPVIRRVATSTWPNWVAEIVKPGAAAQSTEGANELRENSSSPRPSLPATPYAGMTEMLGQPSRIQVDPVSGNVSLGVPVAEDARPALLPPDNDPMVLELARDAARYRALREWHKAYHWGGRPGGINVHLLTSSKFRDSTQLDAAIDAAMSQDSDKGSL